MLTYKKQAWAIKLKDRLTPRLWGAVAPALFATRQEARAHVKLLQLHHSPTGPVVRVRVQITEVRRG